MHAYVLIRTTGRWNNFEPRAFCSFPPCLAIYVSLPAGLLMITRIFVVFRFVLLWSAAKYQRIYWCLNMISMYKDAEMCKERTIVDDVSMMYSDQPIVASRSDCAWLWTLPLCKWTHTILRQHIRRQRGLTASSQPRSESASPCFRTKCVYWCVHWSFSPIRLAVSFSRSFIIRPNDSSTIVLPILHMSALIAH